MEIEKENISQLAHFLAQEVQRRGDNVTTLAQRIGVSKPYASQLLSGQRDAAQLGRAPLVAAADYLDVTVATAYLWAGVLQPTDFILESALNALKDNAFDVISSHPDWSDFMVPREEWNSMSDRARLFFVLAFEEATEIQIIDKNAKTMISMNDSFL